MKNKSTYLIFTCLSCFLLLIACKSTSHPTTQTSNAIDENAIQFQKLITDFQSHQLNNEEANKAFLIAKSYEHANKYEYAEKLYEIIYKSTPNVTVALNLIRIKIALKNTTDAKAIAKHAYVIFPNNSEVLLTLIQIYQIENNIVQVTNLLTVGHKKFPKNESIAILYAYYNKKDSKKILENFVSQNPNSPNALLKLSAIFFEEKNYTQALKFAKMSRNYDPDNIDTIVLIAKTYEELKNYENAEKYYRNAFEKDLDSNIYAQNYVNILLFQKKQQEALSILQRIEASSDSNDPFPPEFTFELGRLLILNQDYAGAIKRFELLLNPQYNSVVNQNEVFYFLAFCYENSGRFQEALNYIEKIEPTSKIAQNAQREKIYIYINSNQIDTAEKLIDNYIINENSSLENIQFKTSVLSYLKKDEEALNILDKYLQGNPNTKELYLKRIEIYLSMNKNTDFILNEANKIIKKWPNYADGLNFVGYLLLEKNKNLTLAEKYLKKALQQDIKNPYYLDSMACLYLSKKNLPLSQKYFLDALKYSPNEPVILYHYSKLLFLLKNDREARKIVEKARTIISNMLIYTIGSDPELKSIAKAIGQIGS